MVNLHITLGPVRYASRIFKETLSLINSGLVERIHILGLHEGELLEHEAIDEKRSIWRIKLRSRGWPSCVPFQCLKYIELLFKVSRFARANRVSLVNVHHLDLLPLGIFLKKWLGAKLVYDAHELETETVGLSGVRKKAAKFIERASIRHCDLVIVVSESIADWYESEYNIRRPAVVLNAPEARAPQPNSYFRDRFGIPDSTAIFIYQGALTRGRGLENLLAAFQARRDDRVALVVMGYGELEHEVLEAAAGSSRILFHPAVPVDSVLERSASADIGIALIENACLSYYYCMPNKLFEYIAAGLPVLVSDMREMRRFVESNNVGLILEENTVQVINDGIDRMIAMDLSQMKENARKAALSCSWQVQKQKMLEAYRAMLAT